MRQRLAALLALAGFGLLVLFAQTPGKPDAAGIGGSTRVFFQIATGDTGSVFFAVGQTVAGLLSHPAGVGRCETSTVCGPSGVILSVRTGQGAVDNLRDVNDGRVDSGFAQGDAVAAAVQGTGEFRHSGPQRHVRVIAALFSEQMYLVAATHSQIHSVADLRHRRVMLGGMGTGTSVTAREVLAAWHVPESALKLVQGDGADASGLAGAGKLDAYFIMAGTLPDSTVRLLRAGRAKLVPIAGPQRDRLISRMPTLTPATIAAGPGIDIIDTVATRAFWVVRDSAPDGLVYGLTRALFNPVNREALAQSDPSAREIALAHAAELPPAPLHPGAARFYREANF